ncbi:amino acid adenylation domain-containing protein [Nonomuraea dietziae]|uniref:amino acid adenylation domain-containing protein n=1 Tax=Nonomuraea dietziae TaxID=65515 RepID=UPI0033FD41CB
MKAPLSPAQERLWLLQRLDPDDAAYTMYLVRRLRGALDTAALTRAFGQVVARHESLRTSFAEQDGVPWAMAEPQGASAPPVEWLPAAGEREAAELVAERVNAPFDLSEGVPLRIAVVRLAADDHVLCLTLHHIIADGTSLNLLLDELGECYGAAVEGRAPVLAKLGVRPSDYARWQRHRAERAAPYWLERLARPPVTELPFARARPSGTGAFHTVRVDAGLAGRVERLAGRHRATPFMVLTAAYQALLSRHSGQRDLLVGAVFAGRDRVELEPVVGYLAQTVVLRADLGGDPSFTELLTRTRADALAAMGRPGPPFERLDLPVDTLLPTMLVLHDRVSPPASFGGLEVSDFAAGYRQAKVGLLVEGAWDDDGGLALTFCHDTGLLDRAEVELLAARFVRLLESAVDRPHEAVSDLRIWTDQDESAIRALASPRPAAREDARGVPELIEASAHGRPEAPAVLCGERTVTYGELWASAGELAVALRGHGVREGDVVGVCLPRSIEAIVALLAVWRAGAAYLPLDPDDPPERHAPALETAGAARVVSRIGLPGDIQVIDPATPHPKAPQAPQAKAPYLESPHGPPPAPPGPSSAAYAIATSGSTGRPKTVLVEHGALAARVRWMREEYGLTPADRVVQFASLSFDAHVEEIFPALAAGACLVLLPEGATGLPDVLGSPAGRGVTVLDLPTAYWHGLTETADEVAWPPGLRLVIIGGEQADAAAVARWRAGPCRDVRLVNTYGPTETTVIATAADLGADDAARRPPIGRPIAATSALVLDGRGRPLPAGAAGELVVGGAGVARGYLGRPDLTADRFVPDPSGHGARRYRTGDRARLRSDGSLEFLGRLDDQLKVRGVRVEPGEVEARLTGHPGVGAAAVTARGDDLVAYYTGAAEPAELRAHAARALPRGLVPTQWVRLDALPLTTGGKLDRAALPEPSRTRTAGGVAPRTETEQLVADVWAGLLGLDELGVFDDLFELGAHSLLATRLAARLRSMLGVEVPIRAVFERTTVAALAEVVEELLLEEIAGLTEEEALDVLTGQVGALPCGEGGS